MLSESRWKPEAVLRFVISAVSCLLIGGLFMSVSGFFRGQPVEKPAWFLSFSALAGAAFAIALFVLGRSRQWDAFLRLMIGLFCICAGLLLMGVAGRWQKQAETPGPSFLPIVVAVVSFQGGILLLTSRFVREHGLNWAEAFGLRTNWKRAMRLGCLMAVLALPIGWVLQNVSGNLLERVRGGKPQEQEAVQVARETEGWTQRLVLGIAAILIAPAAEEILFRGILYPTIKQLGFPRMALWNTSLLFALIHFNLPIFVPLTLLAIALTWLYEKTDNLLAPIVAHSAFNASNFVLLYAMEHLQHLPAPK